ncbi:MAG: hypothetical protein ACRDGS_06015, partial [Chloroflexota bacterium]
MEKRRLHVTDGIRWEDGRLAAKTRHDASRAIGLDPKHAVYLNLVPDDGPWSVDPVARATVRTLVEAGFVIVGMGRRVQAALDRSGLPHLRPVHPAARGTIGSRDTYP